MRPNKFFFPTGKRCLEKGCENVVNTRGLCFKHYDSARMKIKTGKVTKKMMVTLGKIEESTRPYKTIKLEHEK